MVKLSWFGYVVLSRLSRIFLTNSFKDCNKLKRCFKKPPLLIPTLFLNSFTLTSFNIPLLTACPNSPPNFSSSISDASCILKPEPLLYLDLQMLNSTFLLPLHSLILCTKLQQKSSPPPLVWQSFVGVLALNRTFIFALDATSPGHLRVVAVVAPYLLCTRKAFNMDP